MEEVRNVVGSDSRWDVSFGGSFFSNKKMMGELTVILLISVLLMYFILCAQFESFLQPLIVLAEIPMDILGLVLLWATGHTMNLMSAIGIIVSCGIVVNDSILKLDSSTNCVRRGCRCWMQFIRQVTEDSGYNHDYLDYCVCDGSSALYFRFRFGDAAAAFYCYDRYNDGWAYRKSFCNPLIYWFIYRKHETQKI